MATPQPLPPESRTVGQLVAETLRFYQEHFWRVLPLGLALAAVNQVTVGRDLLLQTLVLLAAAPLMTAAYLWASALVTRGRPTLPAFGAGVLIWLPVAPLIYLYSIPAILWLAFIGLAVPAAVAEGLSVRESLKRGRRLGTADYVHALGSLATLVLLFGLTRVMLGFLLRDFGDQAIRGAVFIADLVVSPILYVGSALLYDDQAARLVDSGAPKRRRDADLRDAVDADRPGRPDAEVESRAAARGEP
ncbi:MAG: hypothetical protein WD981_03640 [Gaiellaceae bacterium]